MTTVDLDELRTRLLAGLGEPARQWLADAVAAISADPTTIGRFHAAAGRRVGRHPIDGPGDWHADEAARVLLVAALGDAAVSELAQLHRFGDAREQRAILRALPHVAGATGDRPEGAAMVQAILDDALRSNDSRLVATALGPGPSALLDPAAFRGGVLKAVFMELPLAVVADLDERLDAELVAMLDGLCRERRAAGRMVPDDVTALLTRSRPAPAADRSTGPERAPGQE
jgi:hypothetical protein